MPQVAKAVVALIVFCIITATSVCAEEVVDYPCSGKGYRDQTTGRCKCINPYFGFNCQNKYCPFGESWHSIPKVSNQRNLEPVACSNAGDCDHSTGTCNCREGYEGRACERMSCPTKPMQRVAASVDNFYHLNYNPDIVNKLPIEIGLGSDGLTIPAGESFTSYNRVIKAGIIPGLDPPCSGHGRCRTMREAGSQYDGSKYLKNPPVYYTSWEADKIQGCLCDDGWDGFDCSLRSCPWGRDPTDTLISTYHNEIFTIQCEATQGYFAIDIMGSHTAPISFDADPMYIKKVLEAVDGVGNVDVVMQEDTNGLPSVCGLTSPLKTTFTLKDHPGKLPPVRLNKLLSNSRYVHDSGSALKLANNNAAPIYMISEYKLQCGYCLDCHGQVHFSFGNSISVAVNIITTGAAAAIAAAITGLTDLTSSGWLVAGVDVTMDHDHDKICSVGNAGRIDAGSTNNTVTISIKSPWGNIPNLKLIDGSYRESETYVSKGHGNFTSMDLGWSSNSATGEVYECSNQGECDRTTGTCKCIQIEDTKAEERHITLNKASSSDGFGNPGFLGDCGYLEHYNGCLSNDALNTKTPPCSGNGICTDSKCTCYQGFSGVDCSIRSCPSGPAWFDEPTGPTTAHAPIECSGQGICDHNIGQCICREGFSGDSCDKKDCSSDPVTGEYCSGHGYCHSINEIFELYGLEYGTTKYKGQDLNYPNTWDGNMIYECLCAAKTQTGYFGHPLKPPTDPKDWVGRYPVGARPLPGWTGHDCSLRLCPNGDSKQSVNSGTTSGINSNNVINLKEKQRVMCTLTSGSYTLTTFGQTTPSIPFNANIAIIKRTIESMNVIGNVTVTAEQDLKGLNPGTDILLASVKAGTSVNNLQQTTHTNVVVTSVTGNGASTGRATVVVGGTSTASISSVTITTRGTGYSAGDSVKFVANALGGSSSEIIFTLAASDLVQPIACDSTHATNKGIIIQFDTEGGNIALMTVTSSTGSSVTIEAEQDGTSENLECGGPDAGLCDRDTGICQCAPDRRSSDGEGNLGSIGDCGHWWTSTISNS
jgi:hypothetical protein